VLASNQPIAQQMALAFIYGSADKIDDPDSTPDASFL